MIACEVSTMRRLRWPLAIAIALAAAYGQQVSIQPRQRPTVEQKQEEPRPGRLRIDTTLVLVPVEVSDGLNRPVSGLEKQNFHVFDDKVEQKIHSFSMEDDPIAVGLVFDVSGSMGNDLREMRGAASRFFKTSNPGDEFCLVELASDAHVAVPLTQNAGDVDNKLMFSKGGGSTALLDGVYLGLNEVRKSKNLRKALVIISDGGENNSRYTPGEVKNAIVESDVLIYAIGTFRNWSGRALQRPGTAEEFDRTNWRTDVCRCRDVVGRFRRQDRHRSAESIRAGIYAHRRGSGWAVSSYPRNAGSAARIAQTASALENRLLRSQRIALVAHALMRAVLALVPTPVHTPLNTVNRTLRRHEWRRGTHECVRHEFISLRLYTADMITTENYARF